MEGHSIYCTDNYCAQTSSGDWEIKQTRSSRSLQNTEEQVSRKLQYRVLSPMMGLRTGCQGVMSPRPGGSEERIERRFLGERFRRDSSKAPVSVPHSQAGVVAHAKARRGNFGGVVS